MPSFKSIVLGDIGSLCERLHFHHFTQAPDSIKYKFTQNFNRTKLWGKNCWMCWFDIFVLGEIWRGRELLQLYQFTFSPDPSHTIQQLDWKWIHTSSWQHQLESNNNLKFLQCVSINCIYWFNRENSIGVASLDCALSSCVSGRPVAIVSCRPETQLDQLQNPKNFTWTGMGKAAHLKERNTLRK